MFSPRPGWLCIAILIAGAFSTLVSAQEVSSLTLDEVFRLARDASPEFRAAVYRWEGAQALEQGAGFPANPQVRLSGTVGQPENSANSLVQRLEIAGQPGVRRRSAEAQVSINSLLASKTLRQTLVQVGFSYYDFWQAQQASLVATEQVRLSQSLLTTAEQRYKVGEIAQAEVQRVELNRAKALQDQVSAVAAESIARVQLNLKLGRPTEWNLVLPGSSLPNLPQAPGPMLQDIELDALLAGASVRPEMEIAQVEIRMARLGADLISRESYPDIEVTLAQPRLASTGGYAQLSLVFPLFDWGGVGARLTQKRREVSALEADAAVISRTLELEIRQAWILYQEAKQRRELSRDVALGYLTLADRARLGYEAGVLTLLEVIDQQTAYRQALSSWLVAESSYRKAWLNLRWVAFLPLSENSSELENL